MTVLITCIITVCTAALMIIWKIAGVQFDLGEWNFIHSPFRVMMESGLILLTVVAGIVIIVLLISVCARAVRIKWVICVKGKTGKPRCILNVGIISICTVLVCLGLIIVYRGLPVYRSQSDIINMRNRIASERTIVHALGKISDENGTEYVYTNSYEALNNTYEAGNRVVEVDLKHTSDGKIVCAHGFGVWTGADQSEIPDEKSFMEGIIYGSFTPLNLTELADYMRMHEDLLVITDDPDDALNTYEYLAQNCSDLKDRFIIQIYHIEQYDTIRSLGFRNIIWTLYMLSEDEKDIGYVVRECCEHDLVGVTMWEGWTHGEDPYGDDEWLKKDALYTSVVETGVPVYVHTVNKVEVIQDDFDNGVSAVYTDNYDNDWLRK